MNQLFLIGRSGSKPELRYTPNGVAVLKPAICVSRGETKNGTWVETEKFWVNITVFNKQAEALADQIDKGTKLFVAGRLSIRKYQNRDGIEKQSTDVVASHCFVMPDAKLSAERASIREQISEALGQTFSEEDIPF